MEAGRFIAVKHWQGVLKEDLSVKNEIDLAFPVNLDSPSYVLYLLSRIYTTGTKKRKNKVK